MAINFYLVKGKIQISNIEHFPISSYRAFLSKGVKYNLKMATTTQSHLIEIMCKTYWFLKKIGVAIG